MSSVSTALGNRVEFIRQRTQGKIGDYIWDIVNGNHPKIFHKEELQNYRMSRIREMAMITLWTDEQRQNFEQLTLLNSAARRGKHQGLSERSFKTHAENLIKSLGPAFVVYGLKSYVTNWSYHIVCVFNKHQIDYTVASYDGVHKEKGYWFALSKQLQVIPPGGGTDQNFWRFHAELILPETHISSLRDGKGVYVNHQWVDPVAPRSLMRLTVNGGKSPSYDLPASVLS